MSSLRPVCREKPHLSKPYDRPKSLLQRVTKHVSGYIPSWLNPSSWMVGNTQTEGRSTDGYTNEEIEEEIEEDLDVAGTSACDSLHKANGLELFSSEVGAFARKPLQTTRPNSKQIVVNGDDHSDNSETSASTSGCSSLAPSQEKKRASIMEGKIGTQLRGLQISKHHLQKIQQQLNSNSLFTVPANDEDTLSPEVFQEGPGGSTKAAQSPRTFENSWRRGSGKCQYRLMKNKDVEIPVQTSLWSELSTNLEGGKRPCSARPQPLAPNKRPCFSVSAFGSPLRFPHESSENTEELASPFYKGHTTYGGASAHKKARINSAFSNALQADSVRIRQSGSREILSTAAQKVLNVLENMSTPLTDAKKFPVEHVSTDFALAYTPSIYARKPLRSDAQQSPASGGPPAAGFPAQTSFYQNKPSSLLALLSKTVPSSKAVDSATPKSRIRNTGPELKSGGPVCTRVSRTHRSSKRQEDLDEQVPVPYLPKVPLVPAGSLHSFSFNIPALTSTPIADSHPTGDTSKQVLGNESSVSDRKTISQTTFTQKFVFSNPIVSKSPSDEKVEDYTLAKISNFEFRPPILKIESTENNAENIGSGSCSPAKPPTVSFNFSAPGNRTSTSPLKRKTYKEINTVEAVASELILGGSVMDILGKGSSTKEEQKSETERTGFGAKFGPAAGSWCCPTCMINNTESTLNCVACSEPKPGAKKQTADILSTDGNTSVGKMTPRETEIPLSAPKTWIGPPIATTGTWECDTCLVRNKEGISKCSACETPRLSISTPGFGTKADANANSSSTGFKFGLPVTTSSGFKFGLPATTDSKEAPKTDGFKFGQTAKESPKTSEGFNFGIPISSDSTETGKVLEGFKFGIPITSDPKEAVKTSEGFKFGAPVTPQPKEAAVKTTEIFNFGVPTTPDFKESSKGSDSFKFGIPIDKTTGASTESPFKFGSVMSKTPVPDGYSFGLKVKPAPTLDGEKAAKALDSSESGNKPVLTTDSSSSLSECSEVKTSNKFVFGGQSAATEKQTDATPTLTFGQKTGDSPKSGVCQFSFGKGSDTRQLSTANTNQKGTDTVSGFSFIDSTLTKNVSEKGGTASPASGERNSQTSAFGGYKSTAGSNTETKQQLPTSTPGNSNVEKTSARPVFGFNSKLVTNSGEQKSDKDGAVTTAVVPSSGFNFSVNGKGNDKSEKPLLTTEKQFGNPQPVSTSESTVPAFGMESTKKAPPVFGIASQQPVFTTASTNVESSSNAVTVGPQTSGGTFVFGSCKPAQTTSAASGGFSFTFGNNSSGNLTKPLGFDFGSSVSRPSAAPPSSTPFTFGKVGSTTSSGGLTQPQPLQSSTGFSFGNQTNTSNNSSTFGNTAAQKPVFGFGGASGSTSNISTSVPVFGQQSSVSTTTEPFRFGANSSLTSGPGPAPAVGGFQLDSTNPNGATSNNNTLGSVFRFGTPQQENQQQPFKPPQAVAPSNFTFGSQSVTTTGSILASPEGTTFPPAENPAFVFGSAAASATNAPCPAPQTASVPQFAFPVANAELNPFSVSSTPASGQRQFRKAIRRVPKKK